MNVNIIVDARPQAQVNKLVHILHKLVFTGAKSCQPRCDVTRRN